MSNWNPNYGGQSKFKKKNRYELVDGELVFAILPPPNFEERNDGKWSEYISLHFGYKNMEGKHRPFASCQVKNGKTKMIEVPDAALDRLNDLKAKLAAAELEGNQPLSAKLKTLVGFMGVYNVDNGHHMNVIGLDGNIGTLKIRHKAKQALDAEIERLRKTGVNPLSFEDGRYFVFTRTGNGNDTGFKVSVYTETVETKEYGKVQKDVVFKVTQEVLNKLKTDGQNLEGIAQRPTSEEVAQIVAKSDLLTGKSPACDEIFDNRWKAARATKVAPKATSVETNDDGPDESYTSPAGPTTVAGATTAGVATGTQSIALSATTTAPSTTTQAVDDLSVEDFLKQIGATA
jgi:hypothetical protein